MSCGLWTTYSSAVRGLQAHIKMGGSNGVQTFKTERLISLLTKAENIENLFQNKFLSAYHNWLPISPTVANIEDVIKSHKVFCTTTEDDSVCEVASFGAFLQIDKICRYTMYFYASTGAKDLFMTHAQKHLSHLLEVGQKSKQIALSMLMPQELNEGLDLDQFVALFGEDVQVVWRRPSLVIEEDC